MDKDSPNLLEEQARQAYQHGDYSKATVLFLQAQTGYTITGNDLKAAEMANDRSVALLQDDKSEEAYQASLGTENVFEKAGDNLRQGMALGNQASALEEMGKFDEALLLYRKSASLFEGVNENEFCAYVLKRISALYFKKGRKLEAIMVMESAISLKSKPTISERFSKKLFGILSNMLNPGSSSKQE